MKYVYGVVPSRRLGKSLGVNLTPFKTCSYSCVYCQLGRTTRKTINRKSFFPKKDVLEEVFKALEVQNVDYVTFAGEGEPTLNKDIGWLIDKIKAETDVPIAVITNSSLLFMEEVREDLMQADVILPSLDAVTPKVFKSINRPHSSISIYNVIDGLKALSEEFNGKIFLEVMLVKGFNDSYSELKALANVVKNLKIDCIHILTPIRPPASNVEPADVDVVLEAAKIFEVSTKEIIIPEGSNFDFTIFKSLEDAVSIMARHPMREDQVKMMAEFFGKKLEDVEKIEGVVKKTFRGKNFYVYIKR